MSSPMGSGRPSQIPEFLSGSGGQPLPAVGFGTARFPSVAEDVKNAVLAALELGYRHLDTASLYRSEQLVGEAVAEAAQRGIIASRGEVFVTTKLWCTQCHPDLVLPSLKESLQLRNIWFEAATLVAVPPPVEISAGNVLKSALAGGLASALSTSMLHPIDTMKTRVQASTLSFPELISKLPQIGLQGLYRGSIPAILGQFSSHGLRTGIFEASKLILVRVAPTLPEIQVQSLASFCSTILGTAVRIPCEVLKQRLQAGIFDNVGEAIVGTMKKDGIKGFFRGTGATLCREVPFYVAGMCLYAEAKKGTQHVLNRDLEPWETIAVGALSGGLAAVVTTPFDVMKTRMMTAPPGTPVSMQLIVFSILRNEGPLGLFKGAIPRFFWIAPLGAMNFAGYELAKKAMIEAESESTDPSNEKKTMVGSRG